MFYVVESIYNMAAGIGLKKLLRQHHYLYDFFTAKFSAYKLFLILSKL